MTEVPNHDQYLDHVSGNLTTTLNSFGSLVDDSRHGNNIRLYTSCV